MKKRTSDYTKADIISLYENDHNTMVFAQNINNDSRSRVDEIIAFSKEAGYKRIGIAHCISVSREARRLEEILNQNFNTTRVGCKVGTIQKSELIGSGYGSACNPIMQAEVLNEQNTDLNIVMALCVGHDLLFGKYSQAPSTTLIVKDERFNNCPSKGLL